MLGHVCPQVEDEGLTPSASFFAFLLRIAVYLQRLMSVFDDGRLLHEVAVIPLPVGDFCLLIELAGGCSGRSGLVYLANRGGRRKR